MENFPKRFVESAALVVKLVVVAVMLGCPGPIPPQGIAVHDRPECPHTWRFTDRAQPGALYTLHKSMASSAHGEQVSVAPGTTDIPEYHDCQRFITQDGANQPEQYDHLYAIFASNELDSLFMSPEDSVHPKAYPVAEIFTDSGTYKPLSILRGFNCLFLAKLGDQWIAALRQDRNEERDCHSPVPLESLHGGNPSLEVRRQDLAAYADSLIPPVARWEWDSRTQQQIVGVACGKGWCEIGARGFVSPADLAPVQGPFSEKGVQHVAQIKGWYDEQELGTLGHDGKVHPSGVRGTVLPVASLDRYNGPNAFDGWQDVAYVLLSRDDNDYKRKMNFAKGTIDQPNTVLAICQDSNGNCLGLPASLSTKCQLEAGAPTPRRWYLRITSNNQTSFRCGMRRDGDPTQKVPGTARWRWLADDETTWVRCTNGCCEGQK